MQFLSFGPSGSPSLQRSALPRRLATGHRPEFAYQNSSKLNVTWKIRADLLHAWSSCLILFNDQKHKLSPGTVGVQSGQLLPRENWSCPWNAVSRHKYTTTRIWICCSKNVTNSKWCYFWSELIFSNIILYVHWVIFDERDLWSSPTSALETFFSKACSNCRACLCMCVHVCILINTNKHVCLLIRWYCDFKEVKGESSCERKAVITTKQRFKCICI